MMHRTAMRYILIFWLCKGTLMPGRSYLFEIADKAEWVVDGRIKAKADSEEFGHLEFEYIEAVSANAYDPKALSVLPFLPTPFFHCLSHRFPFSFPFLSLFFLCA